MRPSRWIVAALFLSATASASEGKWTPAQLLELDARWLRSQGLRLPAAKLWNPKEGTGLLAATVNISGCSAAFVSADGLVLTNHHCLYGMLQEHSTPQKNLIELGFVAQTRAEELAGKAQRLLVPRRFSDVTAQVLAAVPAGADDLARYKAIERRMRELEAACEKPPALRCEVRSFDDGTAFTQIESVQIQDLRLVYAPSNGVGDFGGEVDNWMWPRHGGDFAIARAYVAPDQTPREFHADNVPYKPRFFLPLSTEGVSPGDFVAVLGYPGITFRSLTAREMEERVGRYYPWAEKTFGEWITLMEEAGKTDEATRIAVAGTLKGLLNRHKNAQGQIAGFKRGRILERQASKEQAVVEFAKRRPALKGALAARDELGRTVDEKLATYERDLLVGTLRAGSISKALSLSTLLVRLAREKQKPDLERDAEFLERELPRLRERLEREQKSIATEAERRALAWYVKAARALPADQRIAALDTAFGDADGAELDRRIAGMLGGSRVLELNARMEMANQTPQQLAARKDPLLDLGAQLADELERALQKNNRLRGAAFRLRPVWLQAVAAQAGRPVAPDANGTLRISLAKVQGYSPRDAVWYQPQTTLAGLLAKDTGVAPFAAPERLKQAAANAGKSRWRDAKLGDLPIDFLADGDTTGGNSGSPVIDGRGRVVGVNFDRVWENVSNDFAFIPEVARNVSVDVRYLLWNLEEVDGAAHVLRELGVPPAKKGR